MMTRLTRLALGIVAAVTATSAFAGTITSNYTVLYKAFPNCTLDFGTPIDYMLTSEQFFGVRTGGTDTIVPNQYPSYCVELGEGIGSGVYTHTSVTYLLGSTTMAGGWSGPVSFDATRTDRLQRLWGTYFGGLGTSNALHAAFQLAVWELAFDNDATLVQQLGARLYVKPVFAQPGITNIAQGWLDAVRTGTATQSQQLALLSSLGTQDVITPVPEPASMLALGVGGVMVLMRRRRKVS